MTRTPGQRRLDIEAGTTSSKADRPTVLVVDDDPDLLELMGVVLTEAGYRVVRAADGQRATYLARSERPDLIFLDLSLPKKSGLEVLAELAADARTAAIPVTVVSGHCRYLRPPEQVKYMIEKPWDVERLLALAAQLTGRRAAAA